MFNQPNPLNHKSGMAANGQAVNRQSILSALTRESKPTTGAGTQTGDRAVQDAAKSRLYSAQANMSRDMDKANAQAQLQQQQKAEALTQQGRQVRLQGYQQAANQATSQRALATRMMEDQINLNSQWMTSLIGMLR